MADATPTPDPGAPRTSRLRKATRPALVVWAAGAVAAGLLALGVSGTLSSWTAAILSNTTNSVATSGAVVLQEAVTGSGAVNADCQSSAGGFSNTSTCTEIDNYGGPATPLVPGASQSATVTFTNIGSSAASKLKLTPGSCSQSPTAGTGTPVNPADLCSATATDVNLSLVCNDGATFGGTAYTGSGELAYNGPLGAFSAALTHTGVIPAAGSITCRFTVSLSATASPLDGGITVSQQLTWELDV